ncbi:DNA-binding protein [Lysobacter pythonis]|uniref:DNA-binding protein n=1 Tax=Solilutibacter pythonis TaxID=2483112 RepID=A0A3M2HZH0_9GAMM|nr:DNA-binding protein [Lysobacter pythonis]
MTLQQIAELLDRSPAGIRGGLYADNETSALLAPAKIKIGRRLYFRTAVVGEALDSLGATANRAAVAG